MPAWPSSLPATPLAEGFQETAPDLIARSPMEVGPAKTRARQTAGVSKLRLAFRMTPAQLAIFRAFLKTDLQNRAIAFTWTHPITGAVGYYRIAEPPVYEPIAAGVRWRVSATFELLP